MEKSEKILEKVEENLKKVRNYHLTIDMNKLSGYLSEVEVDVEKKALHSTIQIGKESPRKVSLYWIGKKAYGLPNHVGTWFRVWVPDEPSSRLNSIFGLLKTGKLTSLEEDRLEGEPCWLLVVTPNLTPIWRNAKEYAENFSPADDEVPEHVYEKLKMRIERSLSEMRMQAHFWVSQETFFIRKAIVRTWLPTSQSETVYKISDYNNPWLELSPPLEALEATGPLMSLGLLLLDLHDAKSGWSEKNHCEMTLEALKLIEHEDTQGLYSELYQEFIPSYEYLPEVRGSKPADDDHPSVKGAWAEDAGDGERIDFTTDSAELTVRTFRDMRHFGGADKGLAWEDYFTLRDTDDAKVKKPSNGVSYISAKNWAYSGEDNDKMNFIGAIEAYNYHTFDGRKEAYYRMGHVLHLLQDQAEPDHANLEDHAGSAKTEPQAYKKFYVCLAKAANTFEIESYVCAGGCVAALLGYWGCVAACEAAALGVALIVYGVCEGGIDENQVGFEYLVREYWNLDEALVRLKNRTNKAKYEILKIKDEASFNDYFKNMAKDSVDGLTADGRNLKCPLGLGSLYVGLLMAGAVKIKGYSVKPYGTIPGLDPNIKLGNPVGTGEDKPYMDLADDVITNAINRSAGLLRYFYGIVKHPPFVKSVIVVQDAPGKSLADILSNPQKVIYKAKWEDTHVNVHNREKTVGRKLVKIKDAKINKTELVKFSGASRIYVVATVETDMKELTLELKNSHGDSIDKKTRTNKGKYFLYDFAVPLIHAAITSSCDALKLEFTGEDLGPHFSNRNYPGNKLDGEPEKLATTTESIPYNWVDYQPGIDENHAIQIISPDENEPNNDPNNPTIINYPSGQSPLSIFPLYDLTLHDSNDIDFFLLKLPQKGDMEIECESKNVGELPSDVDKAPAHLTIWVNSDESTKVTFYENKVSSNNYIPLQIPLATSPNETVMSCDANQIAAHFPSGEILFSVKTTTGKKTCYSIYIRHHWCAYRKHLPPLLYHIPDDEIIDVVPWWVEPDLGPPPPYDEPMLFPYPSSPINIRRFLENKVLKPEHFVLRIPERCKLEIDVTMGRQTLSEGLAFTLLDSSGEILASDRQADRKPLKSPGVDCVSCLENSKQKTISAEILEEGVYLLEVKGRAGASYSVQFVFEKIRSER